MVTSGSDSCSELEFSPLLASFSSDREDPGAGASGISSRADFLLAFGIFVYCKITSYTQAVNYRFLLVVTRRSLVFSL